MIQAVIFDLDGTLIDSEPIWKEAEIEIFNELGFKLTYEMTLQTTGLSVSEVVKYWYSLYPWPGNKPFDEIVEEILIRVVELIKQKADLKEGVEYIIDFFKQKNLPMTIASSSPKSYIIDLIQHFKLDKYFTEVFSALEVEYVKPHPAVYIKAAEYLNIPVRNCLAIEDSLYGLVSAKAAMMKTLAVLEPIDYKSSKFDFADLKINSLQNFSEEQFNSLNT